MEKIHTIEVEPRTKQRLQTVSHALSVDDPEEVILALARLYARQCDDLRVVETQDGKVAKIEYTGDIDGKMLQSGEVVE